MVTILKNDNSKQLIKNSIFFILSRIVILFFGFASRPILIKYIGEELIGASSAISSLLSTLSLAELGFHASVIFRLYKPLADENYEECNQYVSVLNKLYHFIAFLVLAFVIIITPFLSIFLKGIEINLTIYVVFILYGLNTSLNYLFADKIQLFFADKKDHVEKKIEVYCEIGFNIVALLSIILFKNYIIYVALLLIKTIILCLFVIYLCKKFYPWLRRVKTEKKYFKTVFTDVKYLSLANFAGYVYFNTDNIVISSLVGTVEVLFFTNYTTVTSTLNNISDLTIRQIEPFIGEKYSQNKSGDFNFPILMTDSFVRFLVANFLIVPVFILLPSFIGWWVGEKYILSSLLLILLCVDMYIFIVHRALSDYIAVSGCYKPESKASLVGAIINLSLSIALVKFLGIEGVLIGTIIANIFFWISRGYIVFKKILKVNYRQVSNYILKNLIYIFFTLFMIFLNCFIIKFIKIDHFIISFVCKGIIIELINIIFIIVFFYRSEEFRFMLDYFRRKK